jgi:MDMPI C-terminal domain
MAASMGFVVGKLGKAPDGARVTIELTGPLSRAIRVAVDGRASVVADFGAAGPTAVIRLDGLQFTRLCGGRPVASAHVEFDGDEELGQRIVDNLAYVM